jgi:magnesium transporter
LTGDDVLKVYDDTGTGLVCRPDLTAIGDKTIWFDLINPTPEEDAAVEQLLGISVPTRAEMREIEVSNRFYHEGGACYMTAYLVHDNGKAVPEGSTATFILTGNKLVSVRYDELLAFPHFLNRVAKGDATANSGPAILIGLLESIVERKADLIERLQDKADTLAQGVFDKNRRQGENAFDVLLTGVGRQGDFVSRVQESSTSLDRVLSFFETEVNDMKMDQRLLNRIATVRRDNSSLADHLRSLSERVSFLLNATLGMITTEQNQIIKLFSVMAVMLMPPTLVASIYGMNFRHMPELEWPSGYPMALLLMFLAALIPFVYFKRKGWL